MDWATALVMVTGIVALLLAYLKTIAVPPDTQTEAIGFHVGQSDDADE